MTITEIRVTAARTFNHPREDYSNLRPSVCMVATLAPDEDPSTRIRELQSKAEALVEDHKRQLLQSIEELHEMTAAQQELSSLEGQLNRLQLRTKELRSRHPQLLVGQGQEQTNDKEDAVF